MAGVPEAAAAFLVGGTMALTFCSLASGSSGNSIYIGSEHTRVLLDAGLSGKAILQRLQALEMAGESLDALFVTHEHVDHIKGVGILSRRFDLPIFATPGTWAAMEEAVGPIRERNRRYVYPGEPCVLNDLCFTPFPLPHDAADPVGYVCETGQQKVCVATDLGHVTREVQEAVSGCDLLLLEANHDVEMLKHGPYPYPLKQRILGDKGHICNEVCGQTLVQALCGRLKYVFLGHLSAENNDPHLAFETVAHILTEAGAEPGRALQLDMASRHSPSRKVVLA